MTLRKGEGGGAKEGEGGHQELLEVDKLIADAEAAAREVVLAANEEERTATTTKKKDSGEAALRTEELQRFFSSLRAEDAFVEDYCYEWIFDAYEAEMNIARPVKIQASIEALKKTGDALRKLGAMSQISSALEQKLEALQALHDKLFDEVQEATVNVLDIIKKKFKGEETEFERRFQTLSESPLVRGVEYDKDSPEAREKALKQEIVEVVFGPIAESRLKGMDGDLESKKKVLNALKAEYETLKRNQIMWFKANSWEESSIPWEVRNFVAKMYLKSPSDADARGSRNSVDRSVKDAFNTRQEIINTIEQAIPRDRLAFEMNRMVIDETLADEHDENTLREAFVALRAFLTHAREMTSRGFRVDQEKFPLDNRLAMLLLGRLRQYGAEMPRVDSAGYGQTNIYDSIPLGQQLIGHQISSSRDEQSWNTADSLNKYASLGFTRAKLIDTTDKYAGTGFGSTPDDASLYYDRPRTGDSEEYFKQAYPTKEAYLKAMFGDEAKFFNMRLAYDKTAQGLVVEEKTRPTSSIKGSALGTEALKTVGWKESRLGALVEPEQSVRDADREFALYLERFSEPQVEAEALFDVRGEQGEFHVYTTDQAMSLLRRARKDARDIVLNVDRALEEGQAGIVSERGSIETQITALKKRAEDVESALVKKEQEVAAARATFEQQLQTEVASVRESAKASLRNVEGQVKKAETAQRESVDRLRKELQEALAVKGGFLGGEKALREAVTRIMGSLPSETE